MFKKKFGDLYQEENVLIEGQDMASGTIFRLDNDNRPVGSLVETMSKYYSGNNKGKDSLNVAKFCEKLNDKANPLFILEKSDYENCRIDTSTKMFEKNQPLINLSIKLADALVEDAAYVKKHVDNAIAMNSDISFLKFLSSDDSSTSHLVESALLADNDMDNNNILKMMENAVQSLVHDYYNPNTSMFESNEVKSADPYRGMLLKESMSTMDTSTDLYAPAAMVVVKNSWLYLNSSIRKIIPGTTTPTEALAATFFDDVVIQGDKRYLMTGANSRKALPQVFKALNKGSVGSVEVDLDYSSVRVHDLLNNSYTDSVFRSGASDKFKAIDPNSIAIIGVKISGKYNPTTKTVDKAAANAFDDGILLSSVDFTSAEDRGYENVGKDGNSMIPLDGGSTIFINADRATTIARHIVGSRKGGKKTEVSFSVAYDPTTSQLALNDMYGNIKGLTVRFLTEPGYGNQNISGDVTADITGSKKNIAVDDQRSYIIQTTARKQDMINRSRAGFDINQHKAKKGPELLSGMLEELLYKEIHSQQPEYEMKFGDKLPTTPVDFKALKRTYAGAGSKTFTEYRNSLFTDVFIKIMKSLDSKFDYKNKAIVVFCHSYCLDTIFTGDYTEESAIGTLGDSKVYKKQFGPFNVAFVTSSYAQWDTEDDEYELNIHTILGDMMSTSLIVGNTYSEDSVSGGYEPIDNVPTFRQVQRFGIYHYFPTGINLGIKNAYTGMDNNVNDLTGMNFIGSGFSL